LESGYARDAIVNMFKDMGIRLGYSEATFSSTTLVPMLEAFVKRKDMPAGKWVPELFLAVRFSHESIIAALQNLYYSEAQPFIGRHKAVLADHSVFVLVEWYKDCTRHNKVLFGGEDNTREIDNILLIFLQENVLSPEYRKDAVTLRDQIARYLAAQF
jgi:nuclear pore complex protein Nup155